MTQVDGGWRGAESAQIAAGIHHGGGDTPEPARAQHAARRRRWRGVLEIDLARRRPGWPGRRQLRWHEHRGRYGQLDLGTLAARDVSAISMELVPRSTRAQKMDVLSSQASLAGYAGVIVAAEQSDKIFPMMMTPAGTLLPEGMTVPPRSLVMGSPGKVKRTLTDDEVAGIQGYADRYVGYRVDYMSPGSSAGL